MAECSVIRLFYTQYGRPCTSPYCTVQVGNVTAVSGVSPVVILTLTFSPEQYRYASTNAAITARHLKRCAAGTHPPPCILKQPRPCTALTTPQGRPVLSHMVPRCSHQGPLHRCRPAPNRCMPKARKVGSKLYTVHRIPYSPPSGLQLSVKATRHNIISSARCSSQ